MKIVAVVPAWNEEKTIGQVLDGIRPYVDAAVVVDDGSDDRTGLIARDRGVSLVRHAVNRGLGAALKTGIAAALALELGADVIFTFDADGQHASEDIPDVIRPIVEGAADLVIGTRLADPKGMPIRRQLANRAGNAATRALFGVRVSDSQSGFRALSRDAARRLELKTDRMEISSEILAEAARLGFRIQEVPIRSVYTAYSLSKGQSFVVGLKTLGRLMLHRARQ